MPQFLAIVPVLHLSLQWNTTQNSSSCSRVSFCDLPLTSIPSPRCIH